MSLQCGHMALSNPELGSLGFFGGTGYQAGMPIEAWPSLPEGCALGTRQNARSRIRSDASGEECRSAHPERCLRWTSDPGAYFAGIRRRGVRD